MKITLSKAQQNYDNRSPDEPSDFDLKQEEQRESRILYEEELIKDIEEDTDRAIYAISSYLHEMVRSGVGDEPYFLMQGIINNAINAPFVDRHRPINTLVNDAIRWYADSLAAVMYPDLYE